jgi:hypothetical protein
MADTTKEKVLLLAPELTSIASNIKQVSFFFIQDVIDNEDYTVTINSTAFTINSGVSATAASIANLLTAAINAGAEPVTADDDDEDGSFLVTADVAGTGFTYEVDNNVTGSDITENWAGEDLFDMILADAILEVKESRYFNEEERAQRYLCAHLLTKVKEIKANPNSSIAGLQREKVGDVENWYGLPLYEYAKGTGYNTTKYGQMFIGIKQRYSMRFI